MKSNKSVFTSRQLLFKELFVGTLIYITVLGFFNDYTSIVYAQSFSIIFYAAVILEVLTCLTFLLKDKIVSRLKDRPGLAYKLLMLWCVWLVLFLSKFVFIWAIDMLLGEYMTINGFLGILVVISSVTIIHKLADKSFKELGSV